MAAEATEELFDILVDGLCLRNKEPRAKGMDRAGTTNVVPTIGTDNAGDDLDDRVHVARAEIMGIEWWCGRQIVDGIGDKNQLAFSVFGGGDLQHAVANEP